MELTHKSNKEPICLELDIKEMKLLNKATKRFLDNPSLRATAFNLNKGLAIFAKYGICIGESSRLKIVKKVKKHNVAKT